MIKKALSKPQVEGKKVDMDKDGDIDSKDYLLKRDQAIKKSKGEVKEETDNDYWTNKTVKIIKGTYAGNTGEVVGAGNGQVDVAVGPQKKIITVNQDEVKIISEMKEETRSVGSMVKTKEFEVGDKVKYKGMNHEITRIVDDRIYIKNLKYSGRPDTWVKAIDLKKSMKEDMDLGHEDNEPHMIKGDLYRIGKYAMELYQMVDQFEGPNEVDFPAWWQAMITDTASKMVKAKHYLDFELKEPSVDAALGVATDEAPMMEAEIGKDEELAGKIMKAIKGLKTKDASYDSDKDNLQKARTALNKGNIDAAEKIAKPYLSEKIARQLKEYTDDNFSGMNLILNTDAPNDISIFKKFFPTGVASIGNAKSSLRAHDNSDIKDRMGRFAPMFVHVQYHEFEDMNGEKYRVHQTQYYNSNYDKQDPNFNPSVTKLSLTKLGDNSKEETKLGSILVKTSDYIKDLNQLNIIKRAM
jgi:hypothetical protein